MRNILSFQQPLSGKEIKAWIAFHMANETEYTPIAKQLQRFNNISNEEKYRINTRPGKSWHGKEHKYKPNVVRVNDKQS